MTLRAQTISSRLPTRLPLWPGMRARGNNIPTTSVSGGAPCQCWGPVRGEPPGRKKSPLNATTSPKLSQNASSADSPPTFTDAASVAALPMARCS